MPFYMDIAEPARKKALKRSQPMTEAEMDPMGFTATPRAPRAWEPDIPTQQVPLAPGTGGPMSQAEMIDAARAYPEQPEPGSIAANLGLDLQRKDTLPLATGQDIFSQAGRGAIKYGVEPTLATAEAWAQGIPYVSDVLAGETSRLNVPPGAPIGATPEPTADVLGLFRGQSPEEVGQQLLKSYYEKPLYGQILTDLFFNPINFAPIRIPGGPGGLRRFNIDPTSTLWRDAPAATKAAIKTGIQDQIGERVAAQVRQVAPDLAPNRVNEIVDILIDDFMKPGMRPEDFQKHADLVINRVRGYDRPPTARPTVSPDTAPVPALEPAAPVGAALPEAAVTPSPAAGVPEAAAVPEPEGLIIQRERQFIQKERIEQHDIVTPSEIAEGKFANVVPRVTADASVHQELLMSNGANAENLYTRAKELGLKEVTVWQGTNAEGAFGIFDSEQILPAQTGGPFGAGFNLSPDAATAWHGGKAIGPEFRGGLGKEGTDNLPVIVQFKMPVELLKDISYDQSIDAYSLNTLEPIPIDKASTKLVYSADPDSPYPYRYFNLLEDEVAGLPRDLLEPIPSIWQRIAPGSTDPVEIRFAYNDELKTYVGRRFVEEQKAYNDLLYTRQARSINPRQSHLDKLREVFENRVAAEGGIRMVSAADLRRIGDDLLDEVRSQPIGQERVPRLIDLRTLREVAPAETGVHRAYHGTVATFDAFRHGASADNSLYGPGVYLTDDPNIATGYAKGSLRIDRNYSGQPIDNAGNVISEQEAFELSQGAPQIWSVDVEVVKFFDIDAPADKEIMDMIRDNPEDWENGFDEGNYDFEDIKTNHDLYDLLVFNFGGVSSAKWEVNDWLAFRGYDTITHVGGGRTGNLPHRVYIALGDPYIGDEITSISPQFGPKRGQTPAVKVIEALPPAPTRPALQPGVADQELAYREQVTDPLGQTITKDKVEDAEAGDVLRPYIGGKQYELASKNPDQWESIAHIEGRLRQLEEVPETGAVVFKNRLLEEVSDGLDPEVAMDATMFIDSLPPNLLSEIQTSFRHVGDETTTIQTGEFTASAVAGTYRHAASLVTIIKSVLNQSADPSRIIIHEIFHHLEQFIPEEELNLLRNQWRRDMADNGERVLKTAAYLRSQADLRLLTDAERSKINKAYRYEGDNFSEWFAETMSDKALRDIYADLPEYRNPLQRAFDAISDIAVAVMNFLLRKGRKDEAEQIYQRILKNEFPERLRYQRTGPGKDDLRFEEAPIGRDAELSGDPSLLFDIRNTRQGPGAPMWTVFYKGTDTRLELSTLGRAGSRSKQSAERIAAEEAQKIKTRAEAEGAPPPRGPEPPETGLDPEQPPTPSVPALVQDNLDRAKLQIELTTGGTGQTLNNIPGISDAQGFFFPKYRMTPELHQSWLAAGMTEWELNTQMGWGRAKLFEQLKAAFGEDALKGWKPPMPSDDIKGGIQNMARYYTENSNTVYLAPFIGDEVERRAFSGTLFDIATRPDMYELNDAQRAALAEWKSHQDDFMDIIIAGYGVDVEKYAVPDNAVFLSNVNVGEGAIEASQTTYQTVTSGGRKHRLFDTAAERQELNPDFIPETDIEALQTGMDMAKSHWAARSTLKSGSGGISKIELMELAHPDLVAAREATIRKVNSLKRRINTAEKRAVSVQHELDPLATRIKNLDDRIDTLDTEIKNLGLEYGPMFSHLSGELYSLKTVLSEAQKRSEVLVERGVGLVDTDKDLIAQLEEAAQDLKDIRERYKGALPTVKVQVGMTSKSINYKLVEEGGLYQYFPVKDVNGIEVAKAAREIVKAENNSIVKLLNNIQQTVLGGDLSPLAAIQGHLALIANPKQTIFKLVGAGKGSIESRDMLHIFREETMNKVIEENWDDVQDLTRYLGIPFVANTPEEFAGGFLKYLKGNIGGKEYSYIKANDAMFAITLRNMLTGYQTNMKMLAADGITGEEAKIISAMVVSEHIPLINWRLAGLSAAQYNARRSFVTSASYLVKPMELVSAMTTGLGKVATKQTLTPRERLSLRVGFNMIATVTALSVATSMYAALRNDEDPVQAGLNAVNPTHPDFATIHLSWTHLPYVQDQKLPMGGPFRAIAKMFAPRDVSWSPVPVPFATLPQWITNRVGPGLQALYRGMIDQDFYGYKIRKGGGAEQAIRTVLFGLESVLPLMPQTLAGGLRRGMEFGESMSDATWQFFGTDARQDSAWQERNKSAARWAESQNFNYDVGGYKDLRGRDRNLYDKTVLGEKQAEAVYQKVKRDAEVGQIPWAVDLLSVMDAQRKAEGFQESDDEKLERFYDPAFAGTGPRESLNPTEWKQQRKQRSLELRATKKAIYYSPEESKWLPQYELDDTDPTDRFFEKMAEIMNEADIDQMDNQAWDDLDQWISEQSQEDQEYIEVDAYGGALTPKVQEYYDDIAKLEEYWQIEEDFFKNVVNDPNIKFLWDQYKNATQSEKATGMYSSLDSIDKALTDLRQKYRYENKDVDGILAKWDYSGIPIHPENFARWVRLPVLPDFQIREAGQTQVPAQPLPTATPALSWEALIGAGSPQPMAQPAAPSPTQPTWESLIGVGAR